MTNVKRNKLQCVIENKIQQLNWAEYFWFYNAGLRPAILKAKRNSTWVKIVVEAGA